MDIKTNWLPYLLFIVVYYIYIVIRALIARQKDKDRKEMRDTSDKIKAHLDKVEKDK